MKQVGYNKYIARGVSYFLAEVSCTPVKFYPFAAVTLRLNVNCVAKRCSSLVNSTGCCFSRCCCNPESELFKSCSSLQGV